MLQRGIQAAEIKITIIYTYFVISLLMILSQKAVLFSERESYRKAVNRYFLCEAVGHVEERCNRESFEQYSHPILNIAHYTINIIFPAIILLYLINCRTLKSTFMEMKAIKALKSLSTRTRTSKNTSSTTPISQKSCSSCQLD